MGDNLKVVWAEFSTLSQAVWVTGGISAWNTHSHFQSRKPDPGFVLLAELYLWPKLLKGNKKSIHWTSVSHAECHNQICYAEYQSVVMLNVIMLNVVEPKEQEL